jgi:hypothetical protein
MITRHDVVDISDVGLSVVSKPMLSLLGRMGDSAKHYPEMVGVKQIDKKFGLITFLHLVLPR